MKGRCDIYVDQLNPAVGGFGVSAVEAVKAGAIPVADCRNIPAELLPDWIATAGDGDELEALLVRLVGEPSLRKRLQDAGRAWSRGEGAFAARGRWFSARFAELLDGRLDPTVAGEAPPVAPRAPRRA